MFNQVDEQALTMAFLDKGCTWLDARMLTMEAKLILMFEEDLSMEEVVRKLLDKKAEEESEAT